MHHKIMPDNVALEISGKSDTSSLLERLKKKNLDQNLFDNVIPFDAPIQEHAAWVFNNIYSKPYPGTDSDIARLYHGMSHICQAAIYAPIWANIFRMHGHEEALQLTDHDIKLIQIALLFHDAAREGDDEDLWDCESAELLYFYLLASGISKEVALRLAEATANKDSESNGYHLVPHISTNGITWEKIEKQPVNIYQIIIHESDCLDVIRARPHFDAKYLFFHQLYHMHKHAMEYLAQLIVEARSIIRTRGDFHCAMQLEVKKNFEVADGYMKLLQVINLENYRIIPKLYNNATLFKLDEVKTSIQLPDFQYDDTKDKFDECNLEAMMRTGRIFLRGIFDMPSAIFTKDQTINVEKIERTLAEVEIYKAARRLGTPTSSSKADKCSKQGNLYRSVILAYPGAQVLTPYGFGIIDPEDNKISSISDTDTDTGWDKKKWFSENNQRLFGPAINQKKNSLMDTLKMGGTSKPYPGCKFPATNSEITYDIEKFDFIYFANDPCRTHDVHTGNAEPAHPFVPLIMVLYLQQEYQQKHHTRLPLIEYSGVHGYIRHCADLGEDDIINIWLNMCADYVFSQKHDVLKLARLIAEPSLDALKMKAVMGDKYVALPFMVKEFRLPDKYYSASLKKSINHSIKMKINQLAIEKNENIIQVLVTGNELPMDCLNDEDIISIWAIMCADYINSLYHDKKLREIATFLGEPSLANLKMNVVLKERHVLASLLEKHLRSGKYYSDFLVERINNAIMIEIKKVGIEQKNEEDIDEMLQIIMVASNDAEAYKDYLTNKRSNFIIAGICYLIAAVNGHTDLLEWMLKRGNISPNNITNSKTRNSLLWLAASSGHLETVKMLVRGGSIIDNANNQGLTPLHTAAEQGHSAIVKYLLIQGANLRATTNTGKTVVDIATNPEVIKILNVYDTSVNTSEEKAYKTFSLG